MRLPEPAVFRRKHNWPRWTDAASPHNTSEIIVRSPHAPYPISLSLRRGSVLFCSLSSLPRARSSCPLGWCRPALKGFGFLFLVFRLCSPHAAVCWYYVYLCTVGACHIRELRCTSEMDFAMGTEG